MASVQSSLPVAINQQAKRPLCCHERPDPGNHITEHKGRQIAQHAEYDIMLLLTYPQSGRLAGAR